MFIILSIDPDRALSAGPEAEKEIGRRRIDRRRSQMNVLAISNYFDRDGVTSKTLTESLSLAALGVRLVVIVPTNPLAKSDAAAKLRALGLRHYFAPTHFRTLYPLFPWALLRVGRIIRRERIDLLYVTHRKTLVLGVLLSRLCRVPLVYTIHGVSGGELPKRAREFWFRGVDRVIAVSEESADYFKRSVRYPADRVTVGRNGIDFRHFDRRPVPPDGHFNLLYISRLDRDKSRAVHAVMEAAALIAPERPAIRLRVLGAGRRSGEIRRRAKAINAGLGREVITVEGWVDDPLDSMARADVVLGAGRCVLEAVAAGRPALVVGNERIGGLLTEDNFADLQRTNFSGRGSVSAVTRENLAALLSLLPAEPAVDENVRALARRDHDAAGLTVAIEKIFRQAVSRSTPGRPGVPGALKEESAVPCSPD